MPTSGLDRDQMREMEEIVNSLEEDNRFVSSTNKQTNVKIGGRGMSVHKLRFCPTNFF